MYIKNGLNMVECMLHMHVSDVIVLNFGMKFLLGGENVRPEKFQFLEKGQNHNFGYKIVISVKNLEFILYISDDETDFTVGIVS